MNSEEIKTMVEGLDDENLIQSFETAKSDCESASINDPNSDWHESCFASVLIFSQEIIKRKLFASTIH